MPDGHWIEDSLLRLAGRDIPVPIRFGGSENGRLHRMILRFGGVRGESLFASVLAEDGDRCLVAREAIGWDPVTRAFLVTDPKALREIALSLDATTAIAAGIGGFAKGVLDTSFEILGTIFGASPIIFGGIGTLLVFWFLKAALLWLLWNWIVWTLALPCCLVAGCCYSLAEYRILRLRATLLNAASTCLEQS